MKILVDGYNIARPEGTGVATYGRAFVNAGQALGHDISLLFGAERLAPGADRSALFNPPRSGNPVARKLARIAGSACAPFGFHANRLHTLEATQRGHDGIPSDTSIWNSPGIYTHSIGAFRKIHTFSTVTVPGIQLAHWTYPLPLRAAGAINIYTMHDLVPLLMPELTLDKSAQYRRLCQAVAARADHILTVSECSRRQIIEHLGVDPIRVTNTYQPHSITPDLASEIAANVDSVIDDEPELERGSYFLFFGAKEPKKNLARLLEAYLRSGVATPLLIVGAKGWATAQSLAPLRTFDQAESSGKVIVRGYLQRNRLLALVKGAKATFFPSLWEGFGLPAIEAMALSTPVMASTCGGLGEVVGNAALLVDPLDIGAMAAAIARLDCEPALRDAMGAAGLLQAELFSAVAYRQRLNSLFEDLVLRVPAMSR